MVNFTQNAAAIPRASSFQRQLFLLKNSVRTIEVISCVSVHSPVQATSRCAPANTELEFIAFSQRENNNSIITKQTHAHQHATTICRVRLFWRMKISSDATICLHSGQYGNLKYNFFTHAHLIEKPECKSTYTTNRSV